LLPESVVWLCANNRVAEAEQIIRNAAKLNNISMPDKILAQPKIIATVGGDGAKVGTKKYDKLLDRFRNAKDVERSEKRRDGGTQYSVLDIFRNRHLTTSLFCLIVLW